MPDLVRVGDVVAVRRPRNAGVLARGRVHRVEAVRHRVARARPRGCTARARTRWRRSRPPRRPDPMVRSLTWTLNPAGVSFMLIVSLSPLFMNRLLRAFGVKVADRRVPEVRGAVDVHTARAQREELEVARLGSRDARAGRVAELERIRLLDEAPDHHRRAPLGRIAADGVDPRHPAGRVELELHVRRARVMADEVGRVRVRSVVDVRVRVRATRLRVVRIRRAVAHRHAEPERRMELEVPRRRAGAGLAREPRRLASAGSRCQ